MGVRQIQGGPRAERRISEALDVNRRIGDRANEPLFPATLGWVARARGRYGRAIQLGRHAVDLAEGVGHAEFLSWSTQILGWTLADVFAFQEALEQFERSLGAAREAGGRIELIRASCHLPLARWGCGDRDRALDEATAAERLLQEVTAPPGRAYLQGADGPIAIATLRTFAGDAPRALVLAEPVLEAATAAGWHEVIAAAALAVGRARISMQDVEGARRSWETAVERSERSGIANIAWRSHAELAAVGPVAERRAHETRARELVEMLARTIDDDTIRRGFLEGALAEEGGSG